MVIFSDLKMHQKKVVKVFVTDFYSGKSTSITFVSPTLIRLCIFFYLLRFIKKEGTPTGLVSPGVPSILPEAIRLAVGKPLPRRGGAPETSWRPRQSSLWPSQCRAKPCGGEATLCNPVQPRVAAEAFWRHQTSSACRKALNRPLAAQ